MSSYLIYLMVYFLQIGILYVIYLRNKIANFANSLLFDVNVFV